MLSRYWLLESEKEHWPDIHANVFAYLAAEFHVVRED